MKEYEVIDMGEDIYHIWESGNVASTLIVGEKAALLIDTGYGFGDLRAVVESLTSLPYKVINTHCHLDHAGGNYLFDEAIYVHPDEYDVYEIYQEEQKPLIIQKFMRDREPEALPWTPDFDLEAYLDFKECEFIEVDDGEWFLLGGRIVTAFYLPGHTSGSVVLFDDQTGTLFSGDDISDSLWIFFDQSVPVKAYGESLSDFDELPIKQVISAHSRQAWPPEIIWELQRGIQALTVEKSRLFVHPRTGQKALCYTHHMPDILGKDKIYIVYDPERMV